MIQKKSCYGNTGDLGHRRSASISLLGNESSLMESKDCWEEAGKEMLEDGLWEDRVGYANQRGSWEGWYGTLPLGILRNTHSWKPQHTGLPVAK